MAVELIERDQPLDTVRAAVERLSAAPHPNLIQTLAFSSCRGQPFVVREWLNGFTLAAALRAHGGRFTAGETGVLLGQTAAAVDHALAHGIGLLDLQTAAIQVHFTDSVSKAGWQRELPDGPVESWSDFTLKLRPSSDEFSGSVEFLAGESVRRLALLASELLGCAHEATAGFFEGAAGGNQVVHSPSVPVEIQRFIERSIAKPGEFGSGGEYVAALTAELAGTAPQTP